MTLEGPKCCPFCHEEGAAHQVLKRFCQSDYWHKQCVECGITYDSNVNDILDETSTMAVDVANLFREEYQRLFVETPQISNEKGDIYSIFQWDSDSDLKTGIVAHAEKSFDKYMNAWTAPRQLDG